jgi:hypothetical protein
MLLKALFLGIVANQIFENGEDMLAIAHDAFQQGTQRRLALRFAVPFGEHRCGHGNVAPKFLGGMTAQEQPIKKRRLSLRELEVLQWVVERAGHGRHQ